MASYIGGENLDSFLDRLEEIFLGINASAASAKKLATARTVTLGGAASGSVAFDGSKNVILTVTVKDDSHAHIITNIDGLQAALDAKTTLATVQQNANRRLPAGTVIWFAGLTAKKPAGTLICDGSLVSRTQYAALFAAIGTKYGAGDGSTTFAIPNLMDGGDSGNLGRFIRAATSDSEVGTKQADAIRDISGHVTIRAGYNTDDTILNGSTYYAGALYPEYAVWGGDHYSLGNVSKVNQQYNILRFLASRTTRTSSEDRPYAICFLPLIAY